MSKGSRVACGDYGHKTKGGEPCGFWLGTGQTSCPHHDPSDKSRQAEIHRKADAAKITRTIPDQIEITDLSTSKDIQFGFQQVIKAASTQKSIDLKRLEVVIKALNGANSVQQTEEIREQNRILMMLDGHGASIAALQRLREAPVKALPGRKKKPGPVSPRLGESLGSDAVQTEPVADGMEAAPCQPE